MNFLVNKAKENDAGVGILLAHGAGAPMDSEFMEDLTSLYVEAGIDVIRFEFPYMQERRVTGKKRPPDRAPKLLACFEEALSQQIENYSSLFIGGKSMGGRMATLLLSDDAFSNHSASVKGVLCFGYPYHAPGKPEKVRNEHFKDIDRPVLILQGERDAFGTKPEVEAYEAHAHVEHHWLADGNHDLKPRKASGVTHQQNIEEAVAVSVEWIKSKLC